MKEIRTTACPTSFNLLGKSNKYCLGNLILKRRRSRRFFLRNLFTLITTNVVKAGETMKNNIRLKRLLMISAILLLIVGDMSVQ